MRGLRSESQAFDPSSKTVAENLPSSPARGSWRLAGERDIMRLVPGGGEGFLVPDPARDLPSGWRIVPCEFS